MALLFFSEPDLFTMDFYRHPVSAFQAFAVCPQQLCLLRILRMIISLLCRKLHTNDIYTDSCIGENVVIVIAKWVLLSFKVLCRMWFIVSCYTGEKSWP
uniref:Uncharacterized protein n=1 Tax=Kalanchoe fedtschenkoi TaxID=63787 RepID=A0A7N0T231_KALFE